MPRQPDAIAVLPDTRRTHAVFSVLLWTVGVLILMEIGRRNEPRLWILFGVLAGLTLEKQAHVCLVVGGASSCDAAHARAPSREEPLAVDGVCDHRRAGPAQSAQAVGTDAPRSPIVSRSTQRLKNGFSNA